jgi:hypothetical protein
MTVDTTETEIEIEIGWIMAMIAVVAHEHGAEAEVQFANAIGKEFVSENPWTEREIANVTIAISIADENRR